MTLPLKKEMLRAAYDYLCTTPPFNKWNLPDGEEVSFKVTREPMRYGYYTRINRRHTIGISSRCIGFTDSLMRFMAHEMIHLYQAITGMENSAQHNAAFVKLAQKVAKVHGFDPLMMA